jgi:hypothetical protein
MSLQKFRLKGFMPVMASVAVLAAPARKRIFWYPMAQVWWKGDPCYHIAGDFTIHKQRY